MTEDRRLSAELRDLARSPMVWDAAKAEAVLERAAKLAELMELLQSAERGPDDYRFGAALNGILGFEKVRKP